MNSSGPTPARLHELVEETHRAAPGTRTRPQSGHGSAQPAQVRREQPLQYWRDEGAAQTECCSWSACDVRQRRQHDAHRNHMRFVSAPLSTMRFCQVLVTASMAGLTWISRWERSSPCCQSTAKSKRRFYASWPKGTYDPRFNFDGKSTPLVLPPAHGLARVDNETYTAEGPISYWDTPTSLLRRCTGAAIFQIHARLGVNIVQEPDLVTPKLAAPARVPTQPSCAAHTGCVLRPRCGAQREGGIRRELRGTAMSEGT